MLWATSTEKHCGGSRFCCVRQEWIHPFISWKTHLVIQRGNNHKYYLLLTFNTGNLCGVSIELLLIKWLSVSVLVLIAPCLGYVVMLAWKHQNKWRQIIFFLVNISLPPGTVAWVRPTLTVQYTRVANRQPVKIKWTMPMLQFLNCINVFFLRVCNVTMRLVVK